MNGSVWMKSLSQHVHGVEKIRPWNRCYYLPAPWNAVLAFVKVEITWGRVRNYLPGIESGGKGFAFDHLIFEATLAAHIIHIVIDGKLSTWWLCTPLLLFCSYRWIFFIAARHGTTVTIIRGGLKVFIFCVLAERGLLDNWLFCISLMGNE